MYSIFDDLLNAVYLYIDISTEISVLIKPIV